MSEEKRREDIAETRCRLCLCIYLMGEMIVDCGVRVVVWCGVAEVEGRDG